MKKMQFNIDNLEERYEVDKVAKQANGSVLLHSKKSVLLATITVDTNKVFKDDFLPLTVQYLHKAYAANKFPGGFVKREQKPGDFETLTSRLVDRSIRPLFDKSYRYNTIVNILVLSADEESDLQILALKAASMAIYMSDLPICEHISAVRVGKVGDELVFNPTKSQLEESSLDLLVSGKKEEILMIEMMSKATEQESQMQCNEIAESELVGLIDQAKNHIKECIKQYEASAINDKEILALQYAQKEQDTSVRDIVQNKYKEKIASILSFMAKSERDTRLSDLAKQIVQDDFSGNDELFELVYDELLDERKSQIRDNILHKSTRPDGRGLREIRLIEVETNILPNAHSSCLFTRGQTQALAVLTIGGEKDAQMYDDLTSKQPQYDSFMLHYNFPSFSVGEASPIGPSGRREIGHGNLAKKALLSSLRERKGKSIRIVSEILESNGSSSMATVCASSLAIKAAKLESDGLIAGIAMGLVCGDNNEYAILSDISGLEDHDGDMDFKIAGSKKGITALQMDLKVGGISLQLLEEAFNQAKEGREHILGIMEQAEKEIIPNSELLPNEIEFSVAGEHIPIIIGQGGKTIKEIIQKFEVEIDLDRDAGVVRLSAKSESNLQGAKDYILALCNRPAKKRYQQGEILKGKVKKITDFGAFIGLDNGEDGLLHISKISNSKIESVEDILSIDEEIEVKVLSVNQNRVELAHMDYSE